jgi:hypothetical protein
VTAVAVKRWRVMGPQVVDAQALGDNFRGHDRYDTFAVE